MAVFGASVVHYGGLERAVAVARQQAHAANFVDDNVHIAVTIQIDDPNRVGAVTARTVDDSWFVGVGIRSKQDANGAVQTVVWLLQ